MTEIILEKKDGYRIQAKGHADTPVLCSAISCLMYSLAGYLENSGLTHEYTIDDADFDVWWVGNKELFKFMEIAFAQIQASYEGSLKIFREF